MKTKPILQIELPSDTPLQLLKQIKATMIGSSVEDEYHVLITAMPTTLFIVSDKILHGDDK